MKDREFIVWLEGFNDSEPNRVSVTPIQWSRIIKKLKTVTDKKTDEIDKNNPYFDQVIDAVSNIFEDKTTEDSSNIRCKSSSNRDTINKSNNTCPPPTTDAKSAINSALDKLLSMMDDTSNRKPHVKSEHPVRK